MTEITECYKHRMDPATCPECAELRARYPQPVPTEAQKSKARELIKCSYMREVIDGGDCDQFTSTVGYAVKCIAQALADEEELAVMAEREACAKIALSDDIDSEWAKRTDGCCERWVIYELIRARGMP